MLISFSVSNYKSIKGEVQFSMLAKKAFKEHPENLIDIGKGSKLLRSVLVYGANASGKSNFFDALFLVNRLIFSKPDEQLVSTVFNPYRLSEESEKLPIQVSYEFLAFDKHLYLYEIVFSATEVIKEKLTFKPKGQEALLFDRSGTEITFGEYFPKNQTTIIKNYISKIENKERLVLIGAGPLGLEYVGVAYQYLFQMVFWNQTIVDINNEKSEDWLLSILYRNKSNLWFETYKKLIRSLDLGIKDIEIQDVKNELNDKIQYYLTTRRDRINIDGTSESVPFGLFSESVGTHNLISLALPIIDALLGGKVLVVDEIDRSLHTNIVEYLIQLFHDKSFNTKNAQLICTTHNSLLMNPELMRRDQIRIAEKDENGASQLFSLGDFSGLKKDMPFGKYYLSGKFGGTPIIDDLEFKQSFVHGR